MKRLALIGSWKRLGIQLGLLGGLGLAFVGGGEKPVHAGGECPDEELCSFKKPNLLLVLDYSSSMADDLMPGQTRWEAAVEAVENIITTDNGFFDESMHLALMRFGHDPNPGSTGSTIPLDTSGLVDGQSLDIEWYDTSDPTGYYQCTGDDIINFLNTVPPPLCTQANAGDPCSGIGTWTNGALLAAQSYIAQTRSDHPADTVAGDERYYGILLLTDGVWGTQNGAPPVDPDTDPQNPVGTAEALFNDDDVPVYVVAFGDAVGEGFADDLAFAGGTGSSIQAGMGELVAALQSVVEDIENNVIIPECTGGLPRIMVILDASSSMLNDGNVGPAAMGQTGWDQAREALSGQDSIFDVQIAGVNSQPMEDLVHLGLTTFGSDGDQQILVNYGPCMKDNFAWALDPNTSCNAGCMDPWGGPTILWTPQGPSSANYPGFDQDTYSTMPLCDTGAFNPAICSGSATATHTGLELAASNAADYRDNPPALYPLNDDTVFANILITDGQYLLGEWSTNAEVEAALSGMYDDGIVTYVIGFGPAANLSTTELDNMACWGSGGSGDPCSGGSQPAYSAGTQAGLEADIESIIENINFDPCCAFNDCSFNPEPTTGEPDPVVGDDTGGGSSGGDTDTDSATTDASASDTASASDSAASDSASASDTASGGSSSDSSSDSAVTVTDSAGDDDSDSDTEGDSDSGGSAAGEDDGCGCSTDDNRRGGLLGLLTFGIAGVFRRRRRG